MDDQSRSLYILAFCWWIDESKGERTKEREKEKRMIFVVLVVLVLVVLWFGQAWNKNKNINFFFILFHSYEIYDGLNSKKTQYQYKININYRKKQYIHFKYFGCVVIRFDSISGKRKNAKWIQKFFF